MINFQKSMQRQFLVLLLLYIRLLYGHCISESYPNQRQDVLQNCKELKSCPDLCTEKLTKLGVLKLADDGIEEIPNNIDHTPMLKIL